MRLSLTLPYFHCATAYASCQNHELGWCLCYGGLVLTVDLVLTLRYNKSAVQVVSFRKVPNLVKVLCCDLYGFLLSSYEPELASFAVRSAVDEVVNGEVHGIFGGVDYSFLVRSDDVDSAV